jgi:hypothetical protein
MFRAEKSPGNARREIAALVREFPYQHDGIMTVLIKRVGITRRRFANQTLCVSRISSGHCARAFLNYKCDSIASIAAFRQSNQTDGIWIPGGN